LALVVLASGLDPRSDAPKIGPTHPPAGKRFLLEHVQHIYDFGKVDRRDGAVSVAVVVLDDFDNAWSESLSVCTRRVEGSRLNVE